MLQCVRIFQFLWQMDATAHVFNDFHSGKEIEYDRRNMCVHHFREFFYSKKFWFVFHSVTCSIEILILVIFGTSRIWGSQICSVTPWGLHGLPNGSHTRMRSVLMVAPFKLLHTVAIGVLVAFTQLNRCSHKRNSQPVTLPKCFVLFEGLCVNWSRTGQYRSVMIRTLSFSENTTALYESNCVNH